MAPGPRLGDLWLRARCLRHGAAEAAQLRAADPAAASARSKSSSACPRLTKRVGRAGFVSACMRWIDARSLHHRHRAGDRLRGTALASHVARGVSPTCRLAPRRRRRSVAHLRHPRNVAGGAACAGVRASGRASQGAHLRSLRAPGPQFCGPALRSRQARRTRPRLRSLREAIQAAARTGSDELRFVNRLSHRGRLASLARHALPLLHAGGRAHWRQGCPRAIGG